MSKHSKLTKKEVKRITSEALDKLMISRNDLERTIILSELMVVLDNEIIEWQVMIADESAKEGEGLDNLINEASNHISECNELREKIAPVIKEYRRNTLQLLEVERRKGKYPDKIAYVDFEPSPNLLAVKN